MSKRTMILFEKKKEEVKETDVLYND